MVRASVIATVVAIAFNYVGFRYFTYRDRDKSGRTKELTLFLLFSAIGLVIENGVLYTATYGFGWDSPLQSNVFKFVGIGVATLFRFWSYRTWVFRALPGREARGAARKAIRLAPRRHAGPAGRRDRADRVRVRRLAPVLAVRPPGRRAVPASASRARKSAKTGGRCWSSSSRPPSASARSRATARPSPVEFRPLTVRSKTRAPSVRRHAPAPRR